MNFIMTYLKILFFLFYAYEFFALIYVCVPVYHVCAGHVESRKLDPLKLSY